MKAKIIGFMKRHADKVKAAVAGFVSVVSASAVALPVMASDSIVTSSDWSSVIDALTKQISVSTIVSVLAVAVGASVGFVFMWWGVRKVIQVIMSAVRGGRENV